MLFQIWKYGEHCVKNGIPLNTFVTLKSNIVQLTICRVNFFVLHSREFMLITATTNIPCYTMRRLSNNTDLISGWTLLRISVTLGLVWSRGEMSVKTCRGRGVNKLIFSLTLLKEFLYFWFYKNLLEKTTCFSKIACQSFTYFSVVTLIFNRER